MFVGDERYYYDNNENLTAQQETSYEPNTMTSEAVIAGRTNKSGMEIYRYDAFNRMVRYNSGSNEAFYTYNADNLRASKTVNKAKTDFIWNGQSLAAEMTGDSVNTYTYDVTGIHLADMNGTIQAYLKDTHNSVVGLTDASGNKLETSYYYDAYGNQMSVDVPNPFGYCGEYYDSESGLIYLRNRYYDSNTGRFTTEDPVKDGLNWYSYCAGNPITFVDPWGLWQPDDEKLSKGAQMYTKYYGERWEEDKTKYDTYVARGDVVGAEIAQINMDRWNREADDIRKQDAEGKVRGMVLNVPVYSQLAVISSDGTNLCWATCMAMWISYLNSDRIDRKLDIAKAVANDNIMMGIETLDDNGELNYNVPRDWLNIGYIADLLDMPGIHAEQTSYENPLSIESIISVILSGQPFVINYQDQNSGHFVLGVGFASAQNHKPLVVTNDPWGGVQRIQAYDEVQTYKDGKEWMTSIVPY